MTGNRGNNRPITNGKLPPFHSAQVEIAEDEARFKVVAAGRRFGKTVLGVSAAFKMASRGGKCRWIAPSYSSDSFHAGWNFAQELAGQIPGVDIHLQRKEISFARVSLNGDGWLQFRTAEEPDALRGEGIDFVCFDESAHVPHLEEMWEQCVRPSLMDRRGGAWFISTPNGFNYFNTLFLRARDDPDWASFQYPTSSNPKIAFDEIEALRNTLPALVARQEIDAEFVQLAGALFKRNNLRVTDEPPTVTRWVRSWDLAYTAKTTGDGTAGAKVGVTSDGTIVVGDVVSGRFEWPEAVRTIAETARLDGPYVKQGIEVGSLQSAANAAVQSLMSDPLLVQYSFTPIEVHKDKVTRALPLISRSEQNKLLIVRGYWNQAFIDELCAFPEGQHDDQVDAVSGAVALLQNPMGAFNERTASLIRIGGNAPGGALRHFTPRRLNTVRAIDTAFQ